MRTVRIATRRSHLATVQTGMVSQLLQSAHPGLEVQVVPMSTLGDTTPGPLNRIGGKGLFTAELEQALREGVVDLAVHSAKDLPAQLPGDMRIVACPKRADPRDALVTADGRAIEDLPPQARVGTSSLRRAGQILRLRPDVRTLPLRGNVETRIRKLLEGQYDAILLAMAGLVRTSLDHTHAGRIHPLEIASFVPAAGQGILAVQALTEHAAMAELTAPIDHAPSHEALLGERLLVRELAGDCTAPLGACLWMERQLWFGCAVAGSPSEPARMVHASASVCATADQAAQVLLAGLQDQGAERLLRG